MIDLQTYQLLDQYINNELGVEENSYVKKLIENNPEIKAEVESIRITNDIILYHSLAELKQTIKKNYPKKTSIFNIKNLFISIGISILLSLLVFLFFNKNISHKNKQNSIVRKIKTKNITISKQPNKKFNKNTTILQSTNHFQKNDSSNNTSIFIDKNNYLNIDSRIVSNNNHNNTSSTNTIKNIDYEKITPILSPCLNTQITANFNVKDACKNQSDGEIQITDIQGGVNPYIITFNNEIIDDATASIYHLNAKNYSIKIQDQNACTNQFEIAVQEKYCIKELMDHSFNPEKGQSWDYQNNYNTNVQVDIIDKLGKTIQTFVLKTSEEIHWNGQTIDGQFADTGSYVCIIKNNEQILEKGFILIYK